MNEPLEDDNLQRLKESYLEGHAPPSVGAAARERFEASNQDPGWHPGWVAASLLLAAMLISITVDRPTDDATSDSLTLPARDFAFPSLSAIDLPPPGLFSIQRPNVAIEPPRPTPIPPTYTNDEVYL